MMRVPLVCAECMQAGIRSSSFIASAEINDCGGYEVGCPHGHRSFVVLQQQRFEILFEIGACALIDGYYREAVSSFTSSLERFREFFIKASLLENGLPAKEIDAFWSQIAKHSERQLGAYSTAYFRETGKPATPLKQTAIEFRNNVIHRGTIPSRAQALEYGQSVLDLIRPALKLTQLNFPKGVEQLILQHMQDARKDWRPNMAVATNCMPTIISLVKGDASNSEKSLEEALKGLRLWMTS